MSFKIEKLTSHDGVSFFIREKAVSILLLVPRSVEF